MHSFFTRFIFVLALLNVNPLYSGVRSNNQLPKISQPGVYQGYSYPAYKGYNYTSHYITMPDSVLLAADIYLPKHLEKGKKVPTILYLTRYVRSIQARAPFNWLKDPIFGDIPEEEIKFFTAYGYACVVVDVRGTGASTGERKMEFSRQEVADDNDIVNWIVAQPWSDGQIGSTGVSYVGTTAELLLANKNPHVKACIPRCNIFDLYSNIVFPGGVCAGPFIKVWGGTTRFLDDNNFQPFTDKYKLLLGIHPVKGDKGHKIWKAALAQHKLNFDVSAGLDRINFRDEVQHLGNSVGCLNDFSIHSRLHDIVASGTPIYRMDGWYDAALAKGCLDDWLNTPNTKKVLIGPWDHGPRSDVSPFAPNRKIKFDLNVEMLRFFDHYLKGIDNGIDKEPSFNYYTVGEEKWNTANTWPPADEPVEKFYLSADNALAKNLGALKPGSLNYQVDYTATSGKTAGWNSLTDSYMSGPTHYADRRAEDGKMLCFTSATFTKPGIITGTPVVHLNFAADSADPAVFCYLEDVAPDSSVTYITEGSFRPLQRKPDEQTGYKTLYPAHSYNKADAEAYQPNQQVNLVFDLLPISYQLKAGHQLRVSVAGADAGHFNLPSPRPTHFQIVSTPQSPSYIDLPISGN
jgi:uncharacterized protein